MIVWGGTAGGTSYIGSGGSYDPATDVWTSLSAVGIPVARIGHTAVWTDTQMIVWGGKGTSGYLATGSRFTPSISGGSWSATVATLASGVPAARMGHVAVWTGSKMIIWGGQSGSIPLGDGAVYSTTADQWTTVSSTNAPAARFDHSAVWTGTELLIAAGANVSGAINSSAGYDPSTQQWRPLSSLGSPAARSQLGAAWSGTELLLFGGTSGTQTMTALQRIAPQPAWYFYRKL